jgi:hypothetical protein
LSKDTPLPTPTHKYNAWANNRKSLGITPQSGEGKKGGVAGDEEDSGMPNDEEWQENQKVGTGTRWGRFGFISHEMWINCLNGLAKIFSLIPLPRARLEFVSPIRVWVASGLLDG